MENSTGRPIYSPLTPKELKDVQVERTWVIVPIQEQMPHHPLRK
jgi:hypothetical protein